MHFLHNGLLELVARYHEHLSGWGTEWEGSRHLPPLWLAVAGACVFVGVGIVVWTRPRVETVSAESI